MRIDYQDYIVEALQLFLEDEEVGGSRVQVAKYLHHKHSLLEKVSEDSFRRHLSKLITRGLADRELISENIKYKKQTQKAQDRNRIQNKAFRESARLENALEEYGKAISEQLEKYSEALKTMNISPLKRGLTKRGVGVIQLTDLHANELIDLPHNQYNFEVLSRRMKLYAHKCLKGFKAANIKKVALLITGDLLNSDRRLDELLNQATNRSKASILMQHLLIQFILEIRNEGYKVTIVSVMGNESRVGKEMPFSKEGLSDNYDFTIVASVKQTLEFSKIKGIYWGTIDKVEEVVEIDGRNWLIAHDLSKYTDKQDKTQSTIGRYSLQGTKISFLLAGHIHDTKVHANSARSSSMTGSNAYNEIALNLAGKAQGNYFIAQDGCIETTVVDLQNTDGIEGYSIVKELEAYNTKSTDKLHRGATVLKIII